MKAKSLKIHTNTLTYNHMQWNAHINLTHIYWHVHTQICRTYTITPLTCHIFHRWGAVCERLAEKWHTSQPDHTLVGLCAPIFCSTVICKLLIQYCGRLCNLFWLLLKLHVWQWQIWMCCVPHRGMDVGRRLGVSLAGGCFVCDYI